ncbi:putative Pilus assembly protein PilP domain-containing protein [Candidatus Magnetomoraceae bacterium gMMP-15]
MVITNKLYLKKNFNAAFMLLFMFLVYACDSQPEPPSEPIIFKEKIKITPYKYTQSITKSETSIKQSIEKPVKAVPSVVKKKIEVPKPVESKPPQVSEILQDEKIEASEAPQVSEVLQDEKIEVSEAPQVSEVLQDEKIEIQKEYLKRPYSYILKDRIDPFMSLIKEEIEETHEPEEIEEPSAEKELAPLPPPRLKTPLEKLDLSQLKLTGIIFMSEGPKAMVEETSGKGYIVNIGTRIGLNSGSVINIFEDKIIIEEKVEVLEGKVSFDKKELKLHKPVGEF